MKKMEKNVDEEEFEKLNWKIFYVMFIFVWGRGEYTGLGWKLPCGSDEMNEIYFLDGGKLAEVEGFIELSWNKL